MLTRRHVVGGLSLMGVAGCAGLGTSRGAGVSLRMATLNIWHNMGGWAERRPLMIAALRAVDADVIALQEVLEDASVGLINQAEDLGAALGGYQVAFVSADAEGQPRRYGNAILTRLPILETARTKLEPLDDYRTALRLRVSVVGRPLDVAVTHLAWQEEAGAVRAKQVDSLMNWLPADGTPRVILGDFNAGLGDEGLRRLTGADYHSVLPLGAVRTTLNSAMGHPDRVIDHVFVSAPSVVIQDAGLFAQTPHQGRHVSDHFGVWAQVRLT